MKGKVEWREATVLEVSDAAKNVRQISFAFGAGADRLEPGAHIQIEVITPHGPANRSYTCVGVANGTVTVAVRRHQRSRGGSAYMWTLEPGQTVRMTQPETRFPLYWTAPHYLLVAGGIGITPIIGMARALKARGKSFRLVYAAQSRSEMAFSEELSAEFGDAVTFFASDEGQRIDIAAEIAALPTDAELYVCGPMRMLSDVQQAWRHAQRPAGKLRFEVFGDSGAFAEQAFEVAIPSKGVTVNVQPNESMLDALMNAGVDMVFDCQRGECGLCAVNVLEHERDIDHRDVFFSDEEKGTGRKMCACVSRFAGGKAVIDVGYRA